MGVGFSSRYIHLQQSLLEIGNEQVPEPHERHVAHHFHRVAVCHVPHPQWHPVCGVIQLNFFPIGIELADGLVVGNGDAPIAWIVADAA